MFSGVLTGPVPALRCLTGGFENVIPNTTFTKNVIFNKVLSRHHYI